MASKTNTDLIRELAAVTSAHEERFSLITKNFGLFDKAIDRLDRAIEETNRKLWHLTMVIIAAILGLVGTLVSVIVRS